jgi:type VI secretion system protein ImpJ
MQPVLWTKGLLLNAQQLQAQDRFLEDALQFRLTTLTYNPWGFHALVVDREALAGGVFSLAAAAGIFPDGLLFEMPQTDAAPPPKPLEEQFRPDQATLDVYLAVPEYRPGGQNVSSVQTDRNTRFRAEVLLRRDENTGLAEQPVQVARKNLRLLVEGESLEGNSVLRVARVRRAASGDYQLDDEFVPPLINISASDYLLAITRRLVEILSAKSTGLAGTRRQKSQSLAEFSIADVASFWLLYTINTHMPQLRHLFETRRGHPAELYAAMVSLAGALTTFSSTVHPRDLPAYDHADPGPGFAALDATIRDLLETVVPANYASLPLRLVRPSIHATAIDQDRYLTSPQWFLAVSAELDQAELAAKAPRLIKLSSADRIDRLVKQALPGLGLTYAATPPSAIPIKVKRTYFQLVLSGAEWDAIRLARHIAAYVPSDFPNAELELVVVLPAAER